MSPESPKTNGQPNSGRGALSNTPNRFEDLNLEPLEFLDGQDFDDPIEGRATGSPRPRKTIFYRDQSRSIISNNDSPDLRGMTTLNPYRGCEHGCIYCYARPTHEYLGFSAGLDFESRIFVKEKAPDLLRKELMSAKWQPRTLSLSGVTDCYQPVERRLGLTRKCLEVLREFRNPFTTISKNHLVTRDIDLISEMAHEKAAACFVSVTSLDADLCGILEPRTSRPAMRLAAIRELSQAGIPVGVMVAPIIPGLTDEELPSILAAAAEAGARYAGYTVVRLPLAVRPLFLEWLKTHFPDRAEKIVHRLQSMRDGKLNDPDFGSRMVGKGIFADQISKLFEIHCRKNGLNKEELELSTASFRRPGEQMTFF